MPDPFVYNFARALSGIFAEGTIPFLGDIIESQKSNEYLKQFSPVEQERLLQQYRDKIGLPKDIDFGNTAFKEHKEGKVSDHKGFKTQIGAAKEDTLEKVLEGEPKVNKEAVKAALKGVFKLDDRYVRAQTKYEESIAQFKELVNKVPVTYSVADIRGVLEEVQEKGRKAIEFQQRIEMENLKKLLEAPKPPAVETPEYTAFKTNFGAAVGGDDKKASEIKEKLIKELEETHKQQLEAFKNKAQENLTILDKAASMEMQRVIFMSQLENMNKQLTKEQRLLMLNQIEEIRKQNIANDPSLKYSAIEIDTEDCSFAAVDPKHLKFIISLTGNKIEHNDGVWSVKMDKRIMNPGYYLSNKQSVETDLLTMAQAVRATGAESITMKINFKDPETQKERARQAYIASLESGFEPHNIKLTDGNKNEIKPDSIFSQAELAQLHANAEKTKAELKGIKDKLPPKQKPEEVAKKAAEMREEISKGRNNARAADKKLTEAEIEQEKKDELEIDTKLSKT